MKAPRAWTALHSLECDATLWERVCSARPLALVFGLLCLVLGFSMALSSHHAAASNDNVRRARMRRYNQAVIPWPLHRAKWEPRPVFLTVGDSDQRQTLLVNTVDALRPVDAGTELTPHRPLYWTTSVAIELPALDRAFRVPALRLNFIANAERAHLRFEHPTLIRRVLEPMDPPACERIHGLALSDALCAIVYVLSAVCLPVNLESPQLPVDATRSCFPPAYVPTHDVLKVQLPSNSSLYHQLRVFYDHGYNPPQARYERTGIVSVNVTIRSRMDPVFALLHATHGTLAFGLAHSDHLNVGVLFLIAGFFCLLTVIVSHYSSVREKMLAPLDAIVYAPVPVQSLNPASVVDDDAVVDDDEGAIQLKGGARLTVASRSTPG